MQFRITSDKNLKGQLEKKSLKRSLFWSSPYSPNFLFSLSRYTLAMGLEYLGSIHLNIYLSVNQPELYFHNFKIHFHSTLKVYTDVTLAYLGVLRSSRPCLL